MEREFLRIVFSYFKCPTDRPKRGKMESLFLPTFPFVPLFLLPLAAFSNCLLAISSVRPSARGVVFRCQGIDLIAAGLGPTLVGARSHGRS